MGLTKIRHKSKRSVLNKYTTHKHKTHKYKTHKYKTHKYKTHKYKTHKYKTHKYKGRKHKGRKHKGGFGWLGKSKPVSANPPIIKWSGWLVKRGEFVENWKLRWFELEQQTTPNGTTTLVLNYYKLKNKGNDIQLPSSEPEIEPTDVKDYKGTIYLKGATLNLPDNTPCGKVSHDFTYNYAENKPPFSKLQYCFSIRTNEESKNKGRTFYMYSSENKPSLFDELREITNLGTAEWQAGRSQVPPPAKQKFNPNVTLGRDINVRPKQTLDPDEDGFGRQA
jgi:hypothetical protein